MVKLKSKNLSDKSHYAHLVLVVPSIKGWGGTKLDKKVGETVAQQYDAAHDAAKFNKNLIAPKDIELKSIQKIPDKARHTHKAMTLKWSIEGMGLLNSRGLPNYLAEMNSAKDEHELAVQAFLDTYADKVEARKSALGTMFDHADYPTVEQLRKRFEFAIEVIPVPRDSDLDKLPGLSKTERERLKTEAQDRSEILMDQALSDVREKVTERVGHLVEKLGDYATDKNGKKKGVFRDSTVELIGALAEALEGMNLRNDKRVADIAKTLREIGEVDPEELRKDNGLRKEIANKAGSVVDKANLVFGG